MIKFLIALLILTSPAYAGQSVCPDGSGGVSNYSSRGGAISGCLYFDPGFNTTQTEYDRIKNLFLTIPRQHIKIVSNSPQEMTAAEKTAINDAMATQTTANIRTVAKAQLDNFQSVSLYQRAFADITKDEFNILRQWITDFKADVAAATSLADLKIRVTANPDLPDRDLTQLKTAIKARVDSGQVDS